MQLETQRHTGTSPKTIHPGWQKTRETVTFILNRERFLFIAATIRKSLTNGFKIPLPHNQITRLSGYLKESLFLFVFKKKTEAVTAELHSEKYIVKTKK
ncbi:hypothetical protein GIX45_10480 [Erwinia sp. CPCC 100877]|nr:hypothetical protein [Erwinia sp. CPCC 100877]